MQKYLIAIFRWPFSVSAVGMVLLLSVCYSCKSTATKNFDMAKAARAGENGYVKGEFIFPLDDRPTPQCHASTIEATTSGLVAAWFGGSHEKNPDVGIWVSRKEPEGEWLPAVEVANGIQSDTLRYPCWNPVLFQPDPGPLMLFYKVGPSPREWWGMLIRSEDGGKTWSEPENLGEGPLGPLIGPVKNKPVQLADGAILCPSSTETKKGGEDFWKVHFEKSSGPGEPWEVIGPINEGREFDAIQPSILTYPDGRMQVLCRTRQNVIAQSWSEDGGHTWSEMAATPLPNPNSGTDAVTLQDGRQLLVYNHTVRGKKFPAGRSMLNLAVSADGQNWHPVMTLERQEGEYSYPAVIQSPDGLVHITYTYQRKAIKYVLLKPDQLGR